MAFLRSLLRVAFNRNGSISFSLIWDLGFLIGIS